MLDRFLEDLRAFIGAFFLIVGLVLIALGWNANVAAGDLNLDLWAGGGYVLFAAIAIGWSYAQPDDSASPSGGGGGRPG